MTSSNDHRWFYSLDTKLSLLLAFKGKSTGHPRQ